MPRVRRSSRKRTATIVSRERSHGHSEAAEEATEATEVPSSARTGRARSSGTEEPGRRTTRSQRSRRLDARSEAPTRGLTGVNNAGTGASRTKPVVEEGSSLQANRPTGCRIRSVRSPGVTVLSDSSSGLEDDAARSGDEVVRPRKNGHARDSRLRSARCPDVILLSGSDSSPEETPRAEDEVIRPCKRRKEGKLQLEVTERLLRRVEDYVATELAVSDLTKKMTKLARVVGHPNDEFILKREVAKYVSSYISALLRYRKAHADPYGDGEDETSTTPMLNVPGGKRETPLPGKLLYDDVASYGLRVRLPDGLKLKRNATRNEILLAFSCFSIHREAKNHLPYLKPNKALEGLEGFASRERPRETLPRSPEHGNIMFLWKALVPDVHHYKVDPGNFKSLQLERFSGSNCFLEMIRFWGEYAVLSLMRRIEEELGAGLRFLYQVQEDNFPDSWLKVTESTYYETYGFSLLVLAAKGRDTPMYAKHGNRLHLLKDHICVLGIRSETVGSVEESRVLGYVWKIQEDQKGPKWTFWLPRRWALNATEISIQAVPLFRAVSEVRRASASSALGKIPASLGRVIFSPKDAPYIRDNISLRIPGDKPAQILYDHYKEVLNNSQLLVLEKILGALRNDQEHGGSNVIAVQGPPGTGKTKVIVCAIALLLAMTKSAMHKNKRILVCAPSNAAVDVIARRLKEGVYMAIGEANSPRGVKVKRQVPSVVRIGPGCTDASLADIDIMQQVERKLNEGSNFQGISAGERTRTSLEKNILLTKQVWCSTLMNIMSEKYRQMKEEILAVIVDEAGQAVEIDCLMPLVALEQRRAPLFILVGDTKQLPPFEDIEEGRAIREKTLLGRIVGYMQHTSNNCIRLNMQYRMHPAISRIPARYFYYSSLLNAPSVYNAEIFERPYHFDRHGRFGPVTFIDTRYMANNEEHYPRRDSACNFCEAEVVEGLVTALVRLHSSALSDGVVLMSPYSRQLHVLAGKCAEIPEMSQVQISRSTVDSMQGDERGIVIMSTVRSNRFRELGFLRDYRRLNVGITRARFSLIVVGNGETLETDRFTPEGSGSTIQQPGVWAKFIQSCRDGSLKYTHYLSPKGRNVEMESVWREFFPEALTSSGISWRKPRFRLLDQRSC